MSVTLMSYNESNKDSDLTLGSAETYNELGQAVTLTACSITDLKFYIKKTGSPTGNMTGVLYAATGTVGTDAKPTGAALATTTAIDVSTLATSYQVITFNFASAYAHGGGDLCVSIKFAGTTGCIVGYDGSTPTDPGNSFSYFNGFGFISYSAQDTVYYIMGNWPSVAPPSSKRGTSTKGETLAVADYGHRPYASASGNYLEYSAEITKQYVEAVGYTYRDADYKQPYLHDNYHSMMYLFASPETQITGQAYGGKRLVYGGDIPRVDDQYFDNSPQVASLSNFNSYARNNYLEMGKGYPAVAIAKETVAPVHYTVTTEGLLVSPQNMYYQTYKVLLGGVLSLSVSPYVYAASKYFWYIDSGAYYGSHPYSYSVGTLSDTSGYNITFTATPTFGGGWSYGIVYFNISLYLTTMLIQSIQIRLSDAVHY
jgi:hypothetical protein